MAFDYSITGNTKLDTSGFTNGISSMTVAAGNLIADFVKSASSKMAELVTSSVDIGASFETALAKVSTIADTSKVSVGDLNKQILDTSGSMGVAAADIAEAAYQAISAGQDTANAVAFAGQASKLAAAGFTSSSSAVDILTTALNAYGLSADQATHVSDVLLTTQNLGKTSVDELSSSMGKVIPLAAAYGVTVENLSSGLAVMTANGIATAEATTYTKSMLNELGDAGSTVGKILQKQTGKSFAQLNAEGKSLGDVLQILYKSVGGSSTAFAGLWSSVEAGTGALSLASGGAEHFNDVLSQMQNSAGATETAYETMTDTFQHKVETMQTAAQNFSITLYDSLEPTLGDVAQWGTDCISTLTTALSEGGPEAMLAAAGEIISDLAAGIAAQLPGLMQTGVEIITQLTQSLTNAMPAMLDTAGEVLGTLAQGIIDNLPELIVCAARIISELVNYLGDHADDIMDKGVQFVESIITGITAALPQLITSAAGLIAKWAAALIAHLPDILKCGATMLTTLVDGIIRSIENLAEAALACVAKLVGVWDGNMDEFGHIGENIVQGIINGIAGMWGKLTSWVSGLIANLVGTASNAAVSGITEETTDVPSRKGSTVTDADRTRRQKLHDERVKQAQEEKAAAEAAAAASTNATGIITNNAGKAAKATKQATATVVKSISDTTTTVKDGVTRTVETVNETLSNGKKQQKQTITETSRQMVDGVLKDVKTITEVAADGTKTVKQTMEDVKASVQTTVKDTQTSIVGGAQVTVEKTTETLTDGSERVSTVTTRTGTEVIEGVERTVKTVTTKTADGVETTVKTIEDAGPQYASAGELLTTQLRTKLEDGWKSIKKDIQTDAVGAIKTLANALKNGDLEQLGFWAASYFWQACTDKQREQITAIAQGALDQLGNALSGVGNKLAALASSLVAKFVPAATTATGAQEGLNVAMDANPILLVISLIGMLVGALLNFASTNKNVANGMNDVWSGVADFMSYIFEGLMYVLGLFVEQFVIEINTLIGAYNLIAQLWDGHIDYVSNPAWDYAKKIQKEREDRKNARLAKQEQAELDAEYARQSGDAEKKQLDAEYAKKAAELARAKLTEDDPGMLDAEKAVAAADYKKSVADLEKKLLDAEYKKQSAQIGKKTAADATALADLEKQLVEAENTLRMGDLERELLQLDYEKTLRDLEEKYKPSTPAEPEKPDASTDLGTPGTTPDKDNTDAIRDNTEALLAANSKLAEMVRQADSLVLSDNMAISRSVAASGTAKVAAAANQYHREGDTNITQNIYSKAQTAADLQREARWEADRAKAQKR
ncbi:phage tail tape measure protein [Faecalibacterium sp. AM43-5AT]|uniref:phage tail tape measure protein n=1 Tax=Faecalibacterium sp. AM43-5AT TaxID=2302957 RepID=UPI000E73D5B6|nr:phage tail tape measure protein [Faecalibacterium sp. AM43-5AT]RJV98605.1 phage tail tape measure protein [Faecalibacterium sp. AM43-5AT]